MNMSTESQEVVLNDINQAHKSSDFSAMHHHPSNASIVDAFNNMQKSILTADRQPFPAFKAGDTLKVHYRLQETAKEGLKSRIQVYEGVCIGRRNRGVHSTFYVRKVHLGSASERTFPLYSPNVQKIEVMHRGKVRRAKIYYLRNLSGKKARISTDMRATRRERLAKDL